MLFEGVFTDLTPQLSAALLSCFTFEEKAEMPRLAEELSGILRQMQVRMTSLIRAVRARRSLVMAYLISERFSLGRDTFLTGTLRGCWSLIA